MASENSAHFACGQILFGLKNSNLNYLLKETPFSAYITIRKKFVRDTIENNGIVADQIRLTDKESQERALAERNKDLETRLALAKVEFEEMEIQKEDMLKRISKHDDEIETFVTGEKVLTEKIKVLSNKNEDLKRTVDEITTDIEELETKNESLETEKSDLDDRLEEVYRELSDLQQTCREESSNKTEKLEKKLYKCQQNLKEATDTVVILENTLENKVSEIESLQIKLKTREKCETNEEVEKEMQKHDSEEHLEESLPSTSKCGTCNYDSADENDLKIHMKSNHVIMCDLCSFEAKNKSDIEDHDLFEHNFPCPNCLNIFRTPDKHETHICKLEIINPTFETLYMRNWLDGNGCNPIMCSKREQEVIILHEDNCVSGRRLCCWSPYLLATIIKNEVTHLERGKYAYERKMRHREILWSKLVEEIEY